MNPYVQLFKYILPKEMSECFDLVDVHESTNIDGTKMLHLHLDEKDLDAPGDLSPNGFYNETTVRDFPIRDYKVTLHVRRRRWKDPEGKTVSNDWQLKAKGTRISKEFAAFLKETLGNIPDHGPLA